MPIVGRDGSSKSSIGEDESKLRVLDLNANDLSSVPPSMFIRPLKFLKGLYLNSTNLTTDQAETILDGLENASNLTHLRLDSTKLVKVNRLNVVTLWQTQISIQQMILEASLTATKLDKIRWGHADEEGMRWNTQGMNKLLSRQSKEFYSITQNSSGRFQIGQIG